MQTRGFGASAFVVSKICTGTTTFASHADEKTSRRLFLAPRVMKAVHRVPREIRFPMG